MASMPPNFGMGASAFGRMKPPRPEDGMARPEDGMNKQDPRQGRLGRIRQGFQRLRGKAQNAMPWRNRPGVVKPPPVGGVVKPPVAQPPVAQPNAGPPVGGAMGRQPMPLPEDGKQAWQTNNVMPPQEQFRQPASVMNTPLAPRPVPIVARNNDPVFGGFNGAGVGGFSSWGG